MKRALATLAFLTCAIVPFTATAASSLDRPAAAVKSAVPDFALGPGDVIEITVLNHEDLNKTLTVMPDGTMTYPFVGEMNVAGKPARMLALEIQRELEKTRNNVQVTVAVREIHSRQVRVVGVVQKPEAYTLKPGWRLMDVVAAAGGFTTRANHINGRIIRSTQVIPLNPLEASEKPDSDANPVLESGDTIFFEEQDLSLNKVYVVGQIGKPGSYELTEGMGILTLLSVAGNATDGAALTRAYIQRGSREIPVNLHALVVEGQMDDTLRALRLEPGDVLFIPSIDRHFAVMGQVNQPGRFAFPETRKITPVEALSLAGGQTQNGDLKRAGIIRVVNGEPTVVPVNVDDIMRKRNPTAIAALQPGDVLYVPSREQKSNFWRDVLSPIAQLGLLGVRILN